jgi:transposase
MDTRSRLNEPGGVKWKNVNVGRLRMTISGKQVDLVASSGRSIGSVAKELGLRDSVLRRWVELRGAGREPTAAARRPTTQATLPSADHAAEIARLQRENERLRMERDILKKSIAIFAGVPK